MAVRSLAQRALDREYSDELAKDYTPDIRRICRERTKGSCDPYVMEMFTLRDILAFAYYQGLHDAMEVCIKQERGELPR